MVDLLSDADSLEFTDDDDENLELSLPDTSDAREASCAALKSSLQAHATNPAVPPSAAPAPAFAPPTASSSKSAPAPAEAKPVRAAPVGSKPDLCASPPAGGWDVADLESCSDESR